jgi:Holliday junction resolvase RusA-like endonuclease
LNAAKYAIRSARPAVPLSGPVYAEITFCFKIPPARKKHVRVGDIHDVRPDRGNCLKLIEDAMSDLVYGDDCQVGDGPVRKIWAERDETRIMVRSAARMET